MKNLLTLLGIFLVLGAFNLNAQDEVQSPAMFGTAIAHTVIGPVSALPALTPEEIALQEVEEAKKIRNPDLQFRNYPYWEENQLKRPDPGLQSEMGTNKGFTGIIQNWSGQSTTVTPPDDNGTAGPNHYMQTINSKYTIYNKTGTLLAGPTNLNVFFSGLPGGNNNDGDPIVLYDEQADRWMMAEFSGAWSNPDYMMIAVSQTNDPTGTWDAWSFLMNGFPDYMKFGVWRDGYYMGTNTGSGDDIYVFERDVMLAGGASPQMVQFNNPNRPNSGFHCVLPMDNDGAFAPSGTPGQFITINDNAWGGGSDALWIFELDVDWGTPGSSTFSRVQVLDVDAFDSYFGPTWDNIRQPNSQKLDAINQILMHRAQYRNFSGAQHLVVNHTVDVDNTDHAGIRWYELEYVGSDWQIRQYGTYAPDADSRWMGSIAMNGNHDIALGYSVSSSSTYPSIRFAGQSASENASATGILDIIETSIFEGSAAQTSWNRWGDYSNLAVDPTNDNTFWYTTQYAISGSTKGTKIASFEFSPPAPVANFVADNLTPLTTDEVQFTDLSTAGPTSWSWTFTPSTVTYVNSTSSSSQNPKVTFDAAGSYTVELESTNANGSNTETKVDYIEASAPLPPPVADFMADITTPSLIDIVHFTDLSTNSPSSWSWSITPSTFTYMTGTNASSQNPNVRFDAEGYYTVELTSTNYSGSNTVTKVDYILASIPLFAPVAEFEADNTTPDLGDTVSFTDLSEHNPTSWLWSFIPTDVTYVNGTSETTQNPDVTFGSSGYYNVELTATNNVGSDSELKSGYILVYGTLAVTTTASPDELCEGDWTQLNALPSGGSGIYTYSWTSTPAGFTSSLQNPVVFPDMTTTYHVEVDDGTNTINDEVTVTVNPLPEIILGDWPDMLCNVGVPPVQLTAAPAGGTYSGTGVSITGVFISSIADTGWNVITYTYEDANACENSAQDSIYVDDCVGVGELNGANNIVNLYPNPSMGSFTIESEQIIERIEIIDQTGKMVLMRKVNDKATAISALRSKGLYFVRIYTENPNALPTVVTKEFIIN